jgi:hypothetical protein
VALFFMTTFFAIAYAAGPSLFPNSLRTVVETFRWSSVRTAQWAGMGFITGVIEGAFVGVVGWHLGMVKQPAAPQGAMVLSALLFGLLLMVGFGLVGGLVAGEVTERMVPNQGIRRSASKAFLVAAGGPLAALVFGALFLAIKFQVSNPANPVDTSGWEPLILSLKAGLVFGLIVAILSALAFGGYACWSHLSLRLILWWYGRTPLDYVRFLDHAVQRGLLCRDGSGYRFMPGLRQEHFTTRTSAESR